MKKRSSSGISKKEKKEKKSYKDRRSFFTKLYETVIGITDTEIEEIENKYKE
jgi:hypothetical protein